MTPEPLDLAALHRAFVCARDTLTACVNAAETTVKAAGDSHAMYEELREFHRHSLVTLRTLSSLPRGELKKEFAGMDEAARLAAGELPY